MLFDILIAMAQKGTKKGTKVSLAALLGQSQPASQVVDAAAIGGRSASQTVERIPQKTLDFPTLGKMLPSTKTTKRALLTEKQCRELIGDEPNHDDWYISFLDKNSARLEADEVARNLLEELSGDSRDCVRAVLGKMALMLSYTKTADEIASEEAEIHRRIAEFRDELQSREDAISMHNRAYDYKRTSSLRASIREETSRIPLVKIGALKHLHALLEFQQQMHIAVFRSNNDALNVKIAATFLQWKTENDAYTVERDGKKREDRLLASFKKMFPRKPFKKWSSSVKCADGRCVTFQHFAPTDGTVCTQEQIWMMAADGDDTCLIDFMDVPAHRAPDAVKHLLQRSCKCIMCDEF